MQMCAIRQLAWLLAIFAYCANAHAFECAPSADAVKQLHPEAWPSWTLRAPGHEGSRCWYAKRGAAHQRPKWIETPEPAPRDAEPIELAAANAKSNVPSRLEMPSTLSPSANMQKTSQLASAITTETNPNRIGAIRETEDVSTNAELRVSGSEVAQAVTDLRRDDLPLRYPNSSEPTRPTDQAFSTPALLAVFGGALAFASLMAGLMTRLRRFP
jgi:hypothetical protein